MIAYLLKILYLVKFFFTNKTDRINLIHLYTNTLKNLKRKLVINKVTNRRIYTLIKLLKLKKCKIHLTSCKTVVLKLNYIIFGQID